MADQDRRMFPPGTPVSPSGWVVASWSGRKAEIRYGAEGRRRGHCTWCAKAPLPKGRRHWCSDECVEEMNRRDPNLLRVRVLTRDKGKPCAICGAALGVRPARPDPSPRETWRERSQDWNRQIEDAKPEVDHITPIVEGGDPWSMDNLRTICARCHKAETSALAARRAEHRRSLKPDRQRPIPGT